ncbi:MAG: hypothetical protein ACP5I8_11655 [Phycisphaerae bacterium]
MFMQKTICKRGKATYFTYQVRESFRTTPKGTRVRTVCNVTKLSPHIRKFIAQWRLKGLTVEVHHLLRQLQTIRLGRLEVNGQSLKTKVTRIPNELNAVLSELGLLELFTQPPAWAPG